MSSGGVRVNAGRKKIGVIINTRIDEDIIKQLDKFIHGASRADRIRKCLLKGLEESKKDSITLNSQNSNIISRFYKSFKLILDILPGNDTDKINIINTYLLHYFTSTPTSNMTLKVSENDHITITQELNKYNWSIDEYTIKPNLITPAVIGSVVEKVVNQKETGAYYTPKDTTNYIAKYSIVFSLLSTCNSAELSYEFYSQFLDQSTAGVLNSPKDPIDILSKAINNLSEAEREKVFESILSFTILDPTCGTGAFIIAAADIMIDLYKRTNMYLHISLNDFAVNLFENCLYGVDIESYAILLIKLRCQLYLFNIGISKNIVQHIAFQFFCGDALLDKNNKETWASLFPEILKKGGFDCLIGNPPYVETSKSKYSINEFSQYRTKECGNLYAYVIEKSLNLLKANNYFGFIVPISIVSTQRMQPLRDFLHTNAESVYYANFSDRPSCVFSGVHQKLTILFLRKRNAQDDQPCKIYTSSYIHWNKAERAALFESINYQRTTKQFITESGVAKLGDGIKAKIIKKVLDQPYSFTSIIENNTGENNVYLNQRMTFWAKCFTQPEPSSEYKTLSITSEFSNKAAAALLNSSLFFMLWETYSDCWHITQRDLNLLRINDSFLTEDNQRKLSSLENKLELKLKETRKYVYTKQTEYIYVHRECIKEIQKIDDLVCDIIGLTEEEKEYIKNYNLRYRLSQSNTEV